jgi:hypothetical protein
MNLAKIYDSQIFGVIEIQLPANLAAIERVAPDLYRAGFQPIPNWRRWVGKKDAARRRKAENIVNKFNQFLLT